MFANNFGLHKNVECGLVCILRPPENSPRQDKIRVTPIPLQSVDIKASIVHAVAQVELTQTYVNKEEHPIEAIYYFPVDSNGSVTHFHAELEGKTIKGVVKPQEEAKAQYEKAVQEKKSAFLVESDKPDIFKVKVGYLKPGSLVKIVIGYVTEVKNEKGSNATRFFIPTTVSPRYIPSDDTDEKSQDLKNMTFSTTTPAPLTINVNVAIQGAFKAVESPSHQISVRQEPVPEKKTWTRAVINLSGTTTDMDRDFVLNIVPKEVHAPRLYQETIDNSTVLMAHLIPSFNLEDQKVELVFVLDRSGSMQGQSIALAKKALMLFLHSLPVDCYFNVVGFGSSFQFLFPKSEKYNDGSLKMALASVERLDADLGGTEILQPLKKVYSHKPIDGYLRQIFVITDGEVSNTDQIIGFVSANSHVSRVFALGIGDGASHDLVEGLASAGGGTAAFATYKENIDSKVLHQLKNAIQPSLTNVNISWDGLPSAASSSPPVEINREKTLLGYGKPVNAAENPAEPIITQVPEKIPPIFDGSQLIVFGLFPSSLPSGITITAESPDGPLSLKINLDASGESELGSTGMLHSLAAIKTIADLQLKILRATCSTASYGGNRDGDETTKTLKDQIIKISCQYGVMSKYTSFVAVDTNNQASDENWVMQTRYVPSQFSSGWHGGSAFNFCGPSGRPARSTPMGSYFPTAAMPAPVAFGSFSMPQQSQSFGFSSAASVSTFGSCKQSTGGIFGAPAGAMPAPVYFGSPSIPQQQQQQSSCFSYPASGAAFGSHKQSTAGIFSAPVAAMNYCMGSVHSEVMDVEEEEFEEYKPANIERKVDLTEEDRLHLLVKAQSFDGSFSLDGSFYAATRLNLDALKSHVQSNGWDEKSYATAAAVMYFSEKFPALKDSWELVALKARKWLQKNAAATMDAMIISATEYIQSV